MWPSGQLPEVLPDLVLAPGHELPVLRAAPLELDHLLPVQPVLDVAPQGDDAGLVPLADRVHGLVPGAAMRS